MNNLTITNPKDSSQTYTYGVKGRKPLWVQEYEKENGKPNISNTEKKNDYEIVQQGDTIVNKTLDKTFHIGQRGKRPTWVKKFLKTHVVKDETHKPVKENTVNLKEWIFRGVQDSKGVVVAINEAEAIIMLNRCTNYPYNKKKFNVFWHQTSFSGNFNPGYWRFDENTNQWYQPEPKKIPQKSNIKNS